MVLYNFNFDLFVFYRPRQQLMVMLRVSINLSTLFLRQAQTKYITSTQCTYFSVKLKKAIIESAEGEE